MKRIIFFAAVILAASAFLLTSLSCTKGALNIQLRDLDVSVGQSFSPMTYIIVNNDFDNKISTTKNENWIIVFEGVKVPVSSGSFYKFEEAGTGKWQAIYKDGDFKIESNEAKVTVR